jgi:polysaccharide biosynthesis transport protein
LQVRNDLLWSGKYIHDDKNPSCTPATGDVVVSSDQAIHSAINPTASDKSARAESIIEIAWRRKGWVFAVTFLCVMISAIVLAVTPKRMTVESRILITRSVPAGTDTDLNTFLNTQAELVRSATVLSRVMDGPGMESLSFFTPGEFPVTVLKDRIKVEPKPQSSVLTVRLSDSNREEATMVVDAVTKSYIAYVADQKKNVAVDTYAMIASDRNKIDADRTDARKLLTTLSAETRSFTPDSTGSSLALEKLKVLSGAFTTAQLEAVDIKSKYEQSLKSVGMTLDNVNDAKLNDATAVSVESIGLLQSNLAGLNQQLIEAKRQFVPTHPAVRTIQAQIKDLQLSQAATLRNAFASAKKREADARELYVKQDELTRQIDVKAAELAMAQDRVKVLDKQLETLDTKLQQMNVTETVGFAAEELDDGASVVAGSESPNTWRTVGFAAIIGVCLGVMSALVREWVSPSLGSAHRIADTVGVPVIGTLPRVNGRVGHAMATVTHDASDSAAAEAFRSIRTSMLFGAGECHTITITSPAVKDGKTTLATNLAISLAQSGKRVALVDANYREPTLHTIFAVPNDKGLTSVLDGDDLDTVMQRTPIEHLDVMPAGNRPEGVSEQLNSSRFNDLLRDLNMRYDHVIFDAPSVSGNSDARVIAAGCDQTILVVHGDRTNRFATTTARDALLSVGATLMGIVINDSIKPTTTYPPGSSTGSNSGSNSGPGLPENQRLSMAATNAEIARRLRASRS